MPAVVMKDLGSFCTSDEYLIIPCLHIQTFQIVFGVQFIVVYTLVELMSFYSNMILMALFV